MVKELETVAVSPPRVTITKGRVQTGQEGALEDVQVSAVKTAVDLSGRYQLPDLIEIMEHLLKYTTPSVSLSRATLVEIYSRTANKRAAVANPYEFATVAVRTIKDKLADQLVHGVKY